MANTRVAELMEMLKVEVDPDKIQELEFDIKEAMGAKDKGMTTGPAREKGVRRRMHGGSEMTDNQKKSGASSKSYASMGDETMAAGSCKGAGAAIRGTKFTGVF